MTKILVSLFMAFCFGLSIGVSVMSKKHLDDLNDINAQVDAIKKRVDYATKDYERVLAASIKFRDRLIECESHFHWIPVSQVVDMEDK